MSSICRVSTALISLASIGAISSLSYRYGYEKGESEGHAKGHRCMAELLAQTMHEEPSSRLRLSSVPDHTNN